MSLGSWGAALWRRIRSGSPHQPDASPTKTGPADLEEVFPWEKVYPEELHWRTHIRPHPLFTILDQSVREFPDRPCVDFMGHRYTYAEIGDLVNRAAKGLAALGLRKGSRVGLLMPNCPYYLIAYFAALKVGATVVNYNPLLSSGQVVQQIRDSGTEIMFTLDSKAIYAKAAKAFNESPLERVVVCSMRKILPFTEGLKYSFLNRGRLADTPEDHHHISFDVLIDNDGFLKAPEIDPRADIAVLQYTGGTTGLSKGAMLTHANLFCNAVQTEMWAIGTEYGTERILAVIPFTHAFGMSAVMNVGLVLGAELIILPRFKAEEAVAVIERTKPTIFIGVPSMFSAITAVKDIARRDLSSLRLCIAGGAPLPARVHDLFERISRCSLVEGYGLTEAGPIVAVNPFRGESRPGSVGLPLPATLVEIIDPTDRITPVGLGGRGEICVTGPQVMAGYLARPEENEVTFKGGRLHTGDIGYIDHDGYLYLVDRIKQMILSGGFNVFPRMVAEAIRRHPAVLDCKVVGVPDDILGEVVKALVVLRPGADAGAEHLREFLGDKLAAYEIPRIFEFTQDAAAAPGRAGMEAA